MAKAQRHGTIVRQMTDTKADVGGRSLGRWILLLPTKLGGGTYAIDLHSNRVLASIWYWTYGDYTLRGHKLSAKWRVYDEPSGAFRDGEAFELQLPDAGMR